MCNGFRRPRKPAAAGVVTNLVSGTESAVAFPSSEADLGEPDDLPGGFDYIGDAEHHRWKARD